MKFKIYEYHWMDHYHNSSWIEPTTNDLPAMVITGVGILVRRDKNYLYFTEGIQSDGDKYNGVMAVMKKNITYMNQIGTVDTSKYKV